MIACVAIRTETVKTNTFDKLVMASKEKRSSICFKISFSKKKKKNVPQEMRAYLLLKLT